MDETGFFAKIPGNVFKRFKLLCLEDGVKIKDRISELIEKYVEFRERQVGGGRGKL